MFVVSVEIVNFEILSSLKTSVIFFTESWKNQFLSLQINSNLILIKKIIAKTFVVFISSTQKGLGRMPFQTG